MIKAGIIEVCDLCKKTYFRKEIDFASGRSIYEDSKLDSFGLGPFYYRICSTCSAKILTLAEQIQKNHEYCTIQLSMNVEDFNPDYRDLVLTDQSLLQTTSDEKACD